MHDFYGDYALEKLVEIKVAEARADAAKDRLAREMEGSPAHEPVSRRVIASAAFAVVVVMIMVHSR